MSSLHNITCDLCAFEDVLRVEYSTPYRQAYVTKLWTTYITGYDQTKKKIVQCDVLILIPPALSRFSFFCRLLIIVLKWKFILSSQVESRVNRVRGVWNALMLLFTMAVAFPLLIFFIY